MIVNYSAEPPGETPKGKPRKAPNMFQEVEGLTHMEMMTNIKSMLQVLGDVASMQIFMKAKTGDTITLNVKATDTIDKVKALILDKRSSINYCDKQLKDGRVADYKIRKESNLW